MSFKKLFVFALVLTAILLIIRFSLQPATLSNATSKSLTQFLIPHDYPNRDALIGTLNNQVRDAAHVLEYFLMSLLLLTFLSILGVRLPWSLLLGALLVFIIAFVDENVQIPVAGRAFEWIDIGKDMLGYTFAAFIFTFLSICYRLISKKKPPHNA